jgi:hypothetical protein
VEAMFEFFGFIVVLIVLCFIVFFIQRAFGQKTILRNIFLAISSIVILHLLLIFLMVFTPSLLPSFMMKYASWIFKMILG